MLRQGQDDRFRDDIHTYRDATYVWQGIDPDIQTRLSTEIPIADALVLVQDDALRHQGENQRKTYIESILSIVKQMKKFRKGGAHIVLPTNGYFPENGKREEFMQVTFNSFPRFLERWGAARLKNLGRSTRNRLTVAVAGEIPTFDERVPLPILLEIFPYHRALRLVLDQNLDRHSQIHPGLEDAFEFIQPNVLEVRSSYYSNEPISADLGTLIDLSNTKRTEALEILSRGTFLELRDNRTRVQGRLGSNDPPAGDLVFNGRYFGIWDSMVVADPDDVDEYVAGLKLDIPFRAPNLQVLRCRGVELDDRALRTILQSAQNSLVVVSLAHSVFLYDRASATVNPIRDILSRAPNLKSIEVGMMQSEFNTPHYWMFFADILEDKLTGQGFQSLEHAMFVLQWNLEDRTEIESNGVASLKRAIEGFIQNAGNVVKFKVTIAGYTADRKFNSPACNQNIRDIQQLLSSKGVDVNLVGEVNEDHVHFDVSAQLSVSSHPYSPLDIPGLSKVCVGQLEAIHEV